MAPLVEAHQTTSKLNANTTTNNTNHSPSSHSVSNFPPNSGDNILLKHTDSSKPNNGGVASVMSYSTSAATSSENNRGPAERPTISLITGISPANNAASSISSNPSSALLTPSTAASTTTTGNLLSGGPKSSPLSTLSSSFGDKLGSSKSLPSISESSYRNNNLPSFHQHQHQSSMYPPSASHSQSLSSPFPSPDVMSSRREEYLHRPFSNYPSNGASQGASSSFGDDADLDDEARARKRYGRPPGAKDKRPRRRRTKAQMEEDALIYGYRDAESVYHSPTSLAKRRRLSPRRNSIGESPDEESDSPPSQSPYTYPAYKTFLLATRDPNAKEAYRPHPVPQSTQPSPTNSFNPYLHRHHLPMSSSAPSSALPSLRSAETMHVPRPSGESPWPSRRPEVERIPSSQIPDSKPSASEYGPSRYPASPIGPTGFSSINAVRPPEPYRPQPLHGDHNEHRGRDPTPRRSPPPPPPEYRRDRDSRWDGPAPSTAQPTTLPRLGELSRLSELDRPRWERPDDFSRKMDQQHGGQNETQLHKIPPLSTSHILNGPSMDTNTSQRSTESPTTRRPSVTETIRTGPEQTAPKPLQVTGSDRPILQEQPGNITSIAVGPNLEADTTKREEEDTDEQIEEYRARMLEQHSTYYNCPPGKARVKREPSYAMPSKSPLHEENERLRSALQRYRQQKGIERLKLEEFINKRCNGDQTMIKELLTITGHISEDDYVGPVKPACL